jgi:hypothetical protein
VSRETCILRADESGVDERWRALWEQSPQRSAFSSNAYLAAAALFSRLQLDYHFVRHDSRDVAGAAVAWRRRGPYREAVVPPFTPYSPFLLSGIATGDLARGLSPALDDLFASIEGSYHMSRFHLHPAFQDVRLAAWRRWEVHPLYTYVVCPREDTHDVTEGWSAATARNFRSSRDDFELLEDGSAAVASIELCAQGYLRNKRRMPLREEQLLPLVQHMRDAGAAPSFAVRNLESDEIDAAITVLTDGSESYYWIAGSHPGRSMTVLIGLMLPILASRGIRRFDFMGANTPSIAEFKRRLGGNLETYYGMTFIRRPELRVATALRRMLW